MELVYGCVSSLRTVLMRKFLVSHEHRGRIAPSEPTSPLQIKEESLIHPSQQRLPCLKILSRFTFDHATKCSAVSIFVPHLWGCLIWIPLCLPLHALWARGPNWGALSTQPYGIWSLFAFHGRMHWSLFASKFHVCVCVSVRMHPPYNLVEISFSEMDVMNSSDNPLCGSTRCKVSVVCF